MFVNEKLGRAADAAAAQLSAQVIDLADKQPLLLPCAEAEIVKCVILKVEGRYRLVDAQAQIDHAIDLLLIASNLDLEQAHIGVQIDSIRHSLLEACRESGESLQRVATGARQLLALLGPCLTTWEQVKGPWEPAAIRDFLNDDLLALIEEIKAVVGGGEGDLGSTMENHERLQTLSHHIRGMIDKALGDMLKENQSLLAGFTQREANGKALEASISQLQGEIQRLEERAWHMKDGMASLRAAYHAQPLANEPALREHIASLEMIESCGNAAAVLEGVLNSVIGEWQSESRNYESVVQGYRSLSLCLVVMAKSRAIVEEVIFFFRSLRSLLHGITADMQARIEAGSPPAVSKLRGINEMFIEQGAQWLAIEQLASTWAGVFESAHRRLKIASDKYVLSSDLEKLLNEAMPWSVELDSRRPLNWDWRTHKLRACLMACRNLIAQTRPGQSDSRE